ncbi:MAG: DUF3365 domain-containing protein [Gammaproteobacteria bacterium]|jgi:hypothetical protein
MRSLTVIGIAGILALSSAFASEIEDRVAASRAVIKEFSMSLKSALKTAIASGGPAHAIEVCKETAPAIAAAISEDRGWDIARTSLKLRNPSNAPDAWERRVLEEFKQRVARGEDPQQIDRHEIVSVNGQRYFRYMKAIPMDQVCLTCHGKELAPPIATKLEDLYPQDQATGFSVGDLRGAFTIRQPM